MKDKEIRALRWPLNGYAWYSKEIENLATEWGYTFGPNPEDKKVIGFFRGSREISHLSSSPKVWGVEIDVTDIKNVLRKEMGIPKKWCVIRNKENRDVVNKWFNENYPKARFSGGERNWKEGTEFFHHPRLQFGWRHYSVVGGYTLLSYEEFLKYIVGNNSTINYEIY